MKRLLGLMMVAALVLAACGGSSADSSSEETTQTDTEASDTETEEPEATEPEATEPETTEAPVEEEAEEPVEAAASSTEVSLGDFTIVTEASFSAGNVSFDVVNDGDFPHEFGIARGNSYEELPLNGNGGIDEAALGADNLGKTGVLNGGDSETISFDLEPGNYVFYCNVGANGPNSHAAQGQVLSVTVN